MFAGMKSLSRLAAALTLGLMIMSALPLPLQAQTVCPDTYIRLSSDHGVPGDVITITGHDFELDSWVEIYFGGIWIEDIHNTTVFFEIDIEVPEISRGTYKIRAETERDYEEASFSVRPGVSLSPRTGAIGDMLTVTGKGFGANETNIEVRRGLYETVDEGISANPDGTWETTFAVPVWARGEHEIRARGSQTVLIGSVRPAIFEVKPGITIGETSGAVGQSIAVSGTGFAANERNIRVVVDRTLADTVPTNIQADETGLWNATFTVPEMPAGEYTVTAEGARTRRRDIDEIRFEIRPVLTLSPDEGHVGTNVTAMGLGFAPNKEVAILYAGNHAKTVRTDSDGSFTAIFSAPKSRAGEHVVKASITDNDETKNVSAIFVMESNPPPIPELSSPADGGRVGFFRRATPTFEWEEVFDDSGVYYNMKVATSPGFEPDSILISETGLTETSYTPEEPLSNGVYYWTVQAVDWAQNESGWSEAQRVRVGRLPMWGFIAIFSFVGLLLILRTYFVLVRPRLYE